MTKPRPNYVDYIERLTGMRTDEVEVSQDREAWREFVVACVIHNHLTRERGGRWRGRE